MNPKSGKPKMENKVALTMCFCLIIVLAGLSAWLYVGEKGLESKVSDMESKTSNLEAQNAELESKVDDLESRLNNSESRVGEQLVIVALIPSYTSSQSISFQILHMGTEEVTISEIRVDGVLNSSSPGWVGNRTLIPGQMGQINLYCQNYLVDGSKISGSYQFRFVTTRGNSFYCVVPYEWWTPTPEEQLEIVGLTWNDNNVTFAVKNTGSTAVTIVEVRVNDEYATMNPSLVILDADSETTITVSNPEGFMSGVKYEFAFITATGNMFFYMAAAP